MLLMTEALANDPLADLDLFKEVAPKSNGWRTDAYVESRFHIRENGERLSLRQRFWGQLHYQSNDGVTTQFTDEGVWGGLVSVFADYDPERRSFDDITDIRLHEAYWQYEQQSWRFTVGKRRITWGTSDGRNTFDLINPIDLSDPLASGSNSTRLSTLVAGGQWTSGQHSVELWLLPMAAVNEQPVFGDPWELTSVNQLRRDSRSGKILLTESKAPRHQELAWRYSHHGKGLDYSLLFFDGYIDDPIILRSGDGFFTEYERYQAYGAQLALGLGQSTIRAEFAYKPDFPLASANFIFNPSDVNQLIIGWDRNLESDRYINVQAFFDRYSQPDVPDHYGITFALSDQFLNESLTIGVRGLNDFSTHEYAVETYAHYQFDDHLNVKTGRYWINGDEGSIYQDYHRNAFTYFQVSYQF
ncbi:hypothetical protein [Veronia pacifica]|uniref:Alginate export domain-containing protein n=1 Tax=Veronia pacifica TaxID=1080227 RepID=A0A1C3EMB5_9GAMM|nr:hypothetical protein [Veronia pacifica]ODA34378.1 hypothetical protein A8L45_06545 [Veronia pacifica]